MIYTVEVEAFKWTGDYDQTEDPEWMIKLIDRGLVSIVNDHTGFYLTILNAGHKEVARAYLGNYIVNNHGELSVEPEKYFNNKYKRIN